MLRRFQRTVAWECPCGDFKVVASRRVAKRPVIDLLLGAHFKQCAVAQADLITRLG